MISCGIIGHVQASGHIGQTDYNPAATNKEQILRRTGRSPLEAVLPLDSAPLITEESTKIKARECGLSEAKKLQSLRTEAISKMFM